MSTDFDGIRRELAEIRRRARTIQAGAVRGDELTLLAADIAASADRLVRLIEDAERDLRRTRRAENPAGD